MPAHQSVAQLLLAALPEARTWSGRPTPETLALLPPAPAVLLFTDAEAAPVQLLTTQHLRRLALARLLPPRGTRRGRADLAEVVRGIRWRPVPCPFEARWWYWRLARALHPRTYRRLIAFRPAWFLHVDWARPIPELRVSERVWDLPGEFLGPWPTRAACQQALEGLWDLFDLCRYPEQVRRAPRGQRCAYAEMGRCDAPCDGSAPLAAYAGRCRSAWRFAGGDVDHWCAAAEARMRAAAAAQRYEQAAQVKQQLALARAWHPRGAVQIRPAAELNFLLALPVTRRRAWKLLLFRQGALEDGPIVPARRAAADTLAWARTRLLDAPGLPAPGERMEQTWLVCHLLLHREAAAAVRLPLPGLTLPPDAERQLAERFAAAAAGAGRRGPATRGGDAPSGADGPPGRGQLQSGI